MAKTTRFFNLTRVLLCVILIVIASDVDARPRQRVRAQNPRYAMIIMDAQSGKILEQENADKPLPPASLTKLMTLFLTFEAIEHGKLSMNSNLVITPNAQRQPPSKLGLRRDEKITINQAIHVLVTRSANDVAMAVAETVGGSQQNFARMMTARARSLGMKNSVFYNPSGLPNPAQKSSARDMAILGRAIMQYFPQHYHVFNTIRFNYKGQTIETHNNLMRRFKGMDGMKTGYTVASGFNLVASAVRNNRRVIVAVFGGRSAYSRDEHVAVLMNRGLDKLAGKGGTAIAAAKPVAVQSKTTQTKTVKPTANAVQVTKTVTTTTTTTVPKIQTAAGPAADRNAWRPDGGTVKPLASQIQSTPSYKTASVAPASPSVANGNWGIQVGAYNSPALSQQSIQAAMGKLRSVLGGQGQPTVVPVTTPQGTVYRARIVGLSPQSAAKACQVLSECMAFATH